MKNTNIFIKQYTHEDFKKLTEYELAYILEKNIPFKVTNIFNLGNNYSYCLATFKLYKDDTEILLTKLENKLLYFLIQNSNNITSIQDIENNIWKNRTKSIFSLRNLIKKIRDKTYYEIIISISGVGYIIGVSNNYNLIAVD